MSLIALKEFAQLIKANKTQLATTQVELLTAQGVGYEHLPPPRNLAAARTLLGAVVACCEAGTAGPLCRCFDDESGAAGSWFDEGARPDLALECLGQTLAPVATTLAASQFLWQIMAEARTVVRQRMASRVAWAMVAPGPARRPAEESEPVATPPPSPATTDPPAATPANGGPTEFKARLAYPVLAPLAPPVERLPSGSDRPGVNWRLIIWAVLGTFLLLLGWAYGQAFLGGVGSESHDPAVGERPRFVIPLTATPTLTPTVTVTPEPGSIITFIEPTATPTPVPGGRVLQLRPPAQAIGWLAEDDPEGLANHFNDSFLYVGRLDGRRHVGLLQFDLSEIPRGSEIVAASLRLTGLRDEQLAASGNGEWRLQLLDTEFDYRWPALDFGQMEVARVWATLEPVLHQVDLGAGRVNQFDFGPEQLALLEKRLQQGSPQHGQKLSFRLIGPAGETDNLFAWDTGVGALTEKQGPTLFLNLGPAPLETPPPYYVIVTSTPTPADIATAMANSVRMTAEATRAGTATPLPPYWVTPVVLTATPTAENEATAQAMRAQATAVALTTGEPANLQVVTLTPTPRYVVITSTPTPADIATAVAQSARLTAEAVRVGTATPLPDYWVTPAVVTSTPAPENTATVAYLAAVAFTTGTPTPLPGNAQTATPTPALDFIEPLVAIPTTTSTPTPAPMPPELIGKILFLSDREVFSEADEPQVYAFDPASGSLGRLTARWPYEAAQARDEWSADLRFRAFTKDIVRYLAPSDTGAVQTEEVPAVFWFDSLYRVEAQATQFGSGLAYGGVWSPTAEQIALVSNSSGDDEIWVVNRAGDRALQLTNSNEAFNAREIGKDTFTPEINKHPSWSPDGQQIVFFSTRSGHSQLWLMNKDGSEPRLLMTQTPYNDWDPVWVKYPDPAPPLPEPE